ncbi:MAG: CIA30 family protein [Desulfuromonadales bacterium]|nr:CIA30 family protein [Desulfuromonadales bacterium]
MKECNGKYSFILIPMAIIFVILLFVGGPSSDSLRSVRYVWGMGHLLCFSLWAYLYVCWRAGQSFFRQLVEVIVLTVLLGGATELIQSGIGREASWIDLGNDLIGGFLGVVFFAKSRHALSPWRLRFIQVPVLLLALGSILPLGKVLIDDFVAWQQFPLLSGFETPLEITRWSGSSQRKVDQKIFFSGDASLQVRLTTQRYSGIGLKDFPHDWTKYSAVSLRVYNPDRESLTLHFRIHDQFHRDHSNAYSDRYNASFDILPGWNRLLVSLAKVRSAPKGRLLDLSKIAGIGVFVGKLDKPRMIYLDEVKLLP